MTEWQNWHHGYDDPASPLSRRLRVVREEISAALDTANPGPLQLLSLCSGDGRDVLPVLATHPRGGDVSGRLVELDPTLADRARAVAPGRVEVRNEDAGDPAALAGATPADLLLLCGIFGNIADPDIEQLIRAVPLLLAPGGSVLWTRHRSVPDGTPRIRALFAEVGVAEVAFRFGDPPAHWSVGRGQRPIRDPARPESATSPPARPARLFTFSTRPEHPELG
jgi:hypothetical protein